MQNNFKKKQMNTFLEKFIDIFSNIKNFNGLKLSKLKLIQNHFHLKFLNF
jgi:ribosomal protein L5